MALLHSIQKLLTQRPPIGGRSYLSPSSYTAPAITTQLDAYANVGWVFSIVSRIAEAIASTEWVLYNTRGKDMIIARHPFLTLWSAINDSYTKEIFLESIQQHSELVGETFWLLVSQGRTPVEIWPIRPDRIRPIPDRAKFISGYLYQVGSERIALEREDVLWIRRPDPRDPYRSLGPIQSLLTDLLGEHHAAQYTLNFFRNGAFPGGIIEFPEMLPDRDYETFITRWKQEHQGPHNAFRVAVLEGAKWHEVKYTQRDMQYEALRRVNRDLILGAFGMPKHMLGIADDVNRANAEAAEVMFARWVVKPRLSRIVGAVNEWLLPRFGSDLELRFVDPVPANRELDAKIAVETYTGGITTRNESRRLIGLDDMPDGNDFVLPGVQALSAGWRNPLQMQKAADPLLEPPEERAERRMRENWGKRLRDEADNVIDALGLQQKIELSDLDAITWDWWEKYGDEVIDELIAAFVAAGMTAEPGGSLNEVERRAKVWAERRAMELLRMDGEVSLVEATQARLRLILIRALDEGWGIGQLAREIRADTAFSAGRAQMIARTETATALGNGRYEASVAQGRNEKHWVTQFDTHVDEICLSNEAQGWLTISQPFQSGHDREPAHPSCRCVVRYRTAQKALGRDIYCPKCGKLVVRDMAGGGRPFCWRCREEFEV